MNKQEKFYPKNKEDSKKIFDKYGFVIYKDVLDKNFLKKFRKNVTDDLRKFGKHQGFNKTALKQPNAAVLMPCLKDILSHPQIINKLKNFISDKIVFTFHAEAHLGMLSDWHKDDGTLGGKSKGYFGEWTYGNSEVQVYRVALYLQDHLKNSAGLSVVPGSHKRSPNENSGEPITLNTNLGDIIIFDPRLTHSGQKDVIPLNWNRKNYWVKKILNILRKVPFLGKILSTFIKIIYNRIYGEKASVFFAYGANNKWTWRYSSSHMNRQIAYTNINKTELPKETLDQMTKQDILIFKDFQNNLTDS